MSPYLTVAVPANLNEAIQLSRQIQMYDIPCNRFTFRISDILASHFALSTDLTIPCYVQIRDWIFDYVNSLEYCDPISNRNAMNAICRCNLQIWRLKADKRFN